MRNPYLFEADLFEFYPELDEFETLNMEWDGKGWAFVESEADYGASATQQKVRATQYASLASQRL